MSVTEATLGLMSTMSEEELLEMYHQARQIVDRRNSPFRPLSKRQILADLAVSRQQIENGEVVDFDRAIDEIEAQHDL